MEHLSDATSVLLAHLPVRRLNELAAEDRFEAPVSGDDLAYRRAELGQCVSCGDDTTLTGGLSRCCGSEVLFLSPEIDDRRHA